MNQWEAESTQLLGFLITSLLHSLRPIVHLCLFPSFGYLFPSLSPNDLVCYVTERIRMSERISISSHHHKSTSAGFMPMALLLLQCMSSTAVHSYTRSHALLAYSRTLLLQLCILFLRQVLLSTIIPSNIQRYSINLP